jgi:hypothetical protein
VFLVIAVPKDQHHSLNSIFKAEILCTPIQGTTQTHRKSQPYPTESKYFRSPRATYLSCLKLDNYLSQLEPKNPLSNSSPAPYSSVSTLKPVEPMTPISWLPINQVLQLALTMDQPSLRLDNNQTHGKLKEHQSHSRTNPSSHCDNSFSYKHDLQCSHVVLFSTA